MNNPARFPTASGTSAVWRVGDVAAFWQRTPTTVMRWVEAGNHPSPRRDPGGQHYWLADEVTGFARGGEAEATPPGRGSDPRADLMLVIGDGGTS